MKSILVVDDEQNIRELFSDELNDAGYKVVTAESAEEALNAMSFGTPDLVIVDIRMPGKSGLELLAEIRQDHPTLPLMVCTALRGLNDDFTVVDTNIHAYLNKPVDLDELREKVKEAIGEPV